MLHPTLLLYSQCLLQYNIISCFNRAVFNQMYPSLHSRQVDRSAGFYFINSWMFVTRSFVNAGWQPSGTYSKQPLPWQPWNIVAENELCRDWHCLGWSLRILTPRYLPYSIIMFMSDLGCPQLPSNVRPSAWLPATRVHWPRSSFGSSRSALPDFIADIQAALTDCWPSTSRKMAQLGKPTSTTKSHKACNKTTWIN